MFRSCILLPERSFDTIICMNVFSLWAGDRDGRLLLVFRGTVIVSRNSLYIAIAILSVSDGMRF